MSQRNQTRKFAIAVSALLTPFLFIGEVSSFRSRSLDAIWNLGHVGLFFALTIGVLGTIQQRGLQVRRYAVAVIAISLLLAATIEVLQGFVGRSQSLEDILLSVGGSALGLTWHLQFRWRKLSIAMLALSCGIPTAVAVTDEWSARRDFPVLAEFRSPLELSRFRFSGSQRLTRSTENPSGGRLEMQPDDQGNLAWQLVHFPPDWSRFTHVEMHYELLGDSLVLKCVLNDEQHERAVPHEDADHFAQEFTLHRGSQSVDIDLRRAQALLAGRLMNVKEIASLRCSSRETGPGTTLVVGAITLR